MEEREAWAVGSWGFVWGEEKGHVISRQVRVCGFLSSLAGLLSPSSFASTSLHLAWILFLPTCLPSPYLCLIPSHCSSICVTTIGSLGFLVTPPVRLKGERFYIFWRELSCPSCVDCRSPYSPGEKEMATHSSTLAWRIPWTEEPGGLLSIGSHRVRHH